MNGITTLRGDLHGILLGFYLMVTVTVFGTMLYSIVKHWKVAGHPGKRFPSRTSPEIVWSLIPCLIVAGLAYPAIRKLDQPAAVAIALECNLEGHAKDGLVEAIRAHPGLSGDI